MSPAGKTGGAGAPGFGTLAVHAGAAPEPVTGAIMVPVFLTSTYVQEAPAKHKGYEYSRTGNPTRTALEKALLNPAIPPARKRGIVAEIVSRDGTISPIVGRMLLMLAERDRLGLLPDLVRAYEERLLEHLQVVRAEVTTARPLPEDRRRALEARLATTTGKRVTLDTRVDPGIIGGIVTRIGSVVYDGSIVRQADQHRGGEETRRSIHGSSFVRRAA